MTEKQDRKHFKLTNDEVDLVEKTFKNGEDLILAAQKALLQIPLNSVELSLLSVSLKGEAINKILKKLILPELNDEGAYLGGISDHLSGLSFENMPAEDYILRIKALKKIDEYLRQQLAVLKKQEFHKQSKISFNDFADITDKTDKDIYIDTFARNLIIGIISQNMLTLFRLADPNQKTDEEIQEQQLKDSSK